MRIGLGTPIGETILTENDNLCIAMGVAGLGNVDLYFFRIFRLYPIHLTYDSELPEIETKSYLYLNYLGKDGLGEGSNVLEVSVRFPFRLLHYAVGLAPDEIWMYKAQPPGVTATGFGYEVEVPRLGDKRDYIPGLLSPYDSPTRFTESLVFSKFTVYYGFYNSTARTIRPSLRILGAGYDCLPITSEAFQDAILAGRKPCRFLTAGSLRVYTYTVPDEWPAPRRVGAELIGELMEAR